MVFNSIILKSINFYLHSFNGHHWAYAGCQKKGEIDQDKRKKSKIKGMDKEQDEITKT